MKIQTSKPTIIASLILALTSCGKEEATTEETPGSLGDLVIEEKAPEDSSGSTGSVSIRFATNSESLALTLDDSQASEEAPTTGETLQVGGLTLSYAKFNVWGIKVKTDKELTDAEETLEVLEKEEDEEAARIDEGEEEAAAGLAGENGSKRRKERRERLTKKKEELKKKAKERRQRAKKRDKATRFHGPYVYDAIKGQLEGDVPAVDLADGSYRRIEFKLKRAVEVAETDPLFSNVFAIRGTWNNGEKEVPFEIDWHMAMNFRLRGDGAFQVASGDANALTVVFDLVKWFEGIELKGATVDESGTIFIDKTSNREIMQKLRRNIKTATRFGKDKDGDGKLNGDEAAGKGEDTADAGTEE